jgi:hypothetical protein
MIANNKTVPVAGIVTQMTADASFPVQTTTALLCMLPAISMNMPRDKS